MGARLKILILMIVVYSACMPVAASHADPEPCRDPNDKGCQQLYEPRCRQAIESMLQIMRSTPVNTPADEKRVGELILNVETMLHSNRLNNMSECRSWSEFGRMLANQ